MSTFVRHDTCPKCGSEDNLGIYNDHEHCFGFDCDYHKNYNNKGGVAKVEKKSSTNIIPLPAIKMPGIKSRGIDATSVAKYQVSVSQKDDNPIEAVFPKFSQDNQHVANQVRYEDKKFKTEGPISGTKLFGQNSFPEGGRSITVTEGFYDAMAAFQITGSRYPNVGVMSASSAKKEVVDNFEYLNSFDTIIFNFDNDDPGQKAAKECAILFDPGKVKILKLSKFKDANEYLLNGQGKDYVDEWYRAPTYMPDGIQLGSDARLRDEVLKYVEPRSVPYPWKGLNEKTYGVRTSELVLLTADTGVGKTSVMKEIEYSLLFNEDLMKEDIGVGFLHLEEPKRKLALGLMSIHNDKPYHFPDVERTEEELEKAYDEVINTSRVVIWDHFGSNDIDVVLAKIRHMAALGCKYIMVDHLSIIVSDQSGDERKQLDEISTKIKTLTMNLDISVFCVIHINRQGQVRGSAGPEQVANVVIRLERDKKELNEWRRNITRLTVEKNREYGRTGPACWLHYNETTGRLDELSADLAYEYEHGGTNTGHEFDDMKE
ncbi:MAG: putative ATP-dependent helicase [Prokaryotic dsDNA virus sp.]|nr:MAG: putative ATP-dependent helicase [Prokaryotic dsDNA virus sp.]|tara:strand:- start:3220 stop:4851 length:1632 start_codon:yes stop_codon:yes gene_type:complete